MPAGTFALGGELEVGRLGYGAMRLCGPGIIGWPDDRENALARRHIIVAMLHAVEHQAELLHACATVDGKQTSRFAIPGSSLRGVTAKPACAKSAAARSSRSTMIMR